jgi:hypothetical protein
MESLRISEPLLSRATSEEPRSRPRLVADLLARVQGRRSAEAHGPAATIIPFHVAAAAGQEVSSEQPATVATRWRACAPTAKKAATNAFIGALMLTAGAFGHMGYANWRAKPSAAAEKSFYDIEPDIQPHFDLAMARFRSSARVRALEAEIEATGGRVDLDYEQGGNTDTTASNAVKTARIVWDPEAQLAFRVRRDENTLSGCHTNSPALNVLHEMVHARNLLTNPLAMQIKASIPLPLHDNVEEFHVIENVMNEIGKEFGEPPRDNHHGMIRPVADLFAHEDAACTSQDVPQSVTWLQTEDYGVVDKAILSANLGMVMNGLTPWLSNAKVNAQDREALRKLVLDDNFAIQMAVARNVSAGVFSDSLAEDIARHANDVIAFVERLPYYAQPPMYSLEDQIGFLNASLTASE